MGAGSSTAAEHRANRLFEAAAAGDVPVLTKLLDAGVMDRDTKVIKDPRRLLNADESPQTPDQPQKGRRPKVAKRKGKRVRKAGSGNKDQISVMMCWDADGHNYGVQRITDRTTLTDDMVVDAPRGAREFDDVTDVVGKQSRYCLISRTENGMQTQKSFTEYLEHLSAQIDARSAAEVAAGGEPILRPVVLTLDNHESRFSKEVIEAAHGLSEELGIRIFRSWF